MSNAIGESLSRLIEFSGAKVTRLCYPADIGLHIAKSVWALQKHLDDMPHDNSPIIERTAFLGKMYVEGTAAYEADPGARDDIDALNKVLYEKSSPAVNALYEKGRKWSLDHFELLYKLLGTKFDATIFESEMAPVGLAIVREFAKKGAFEESDGAIVFKGEKYGLHTRVFINSYGLPTYEAKEMGLNTTKFERYPGLGAVHHRDGQRAERIFQGRHQSALAHRPERRLEDHAYRPRHDEIPVGQNVFAHRECGHGRGIDSRDQSHGHGEDGWP